MKKSNADIADELVSYMKFVLKPTKYFGPPVPIVPFADWDYYYVERLLEWTPTSRTLMTVKDVKVPRGFVTDLASIPRPLWSILPRQARYTYPAVLHDFLYWFQPCEREEADDVLRLAMEELDVPAATSSTIYGAVRMGGAASWRENAERRAAGERRILVDFPPDPKITWAIWKADPNKFQADPNVFQ
ncbi:DUF1353 domain-containing protein [Sinorhizobium fredii]|uniref:DUF1353 domain-containing protein n=1 Tax=Rhizobium fredii TaxID=380 RepID=A0A2L0HB30_RHIFR|nr:DUF1353 domain-containing protein [Sinorhizobium fredii]AUX78708.1 hypothetical protein NXT3_PB00046 [Sinorhizobium fredii]